MVKQANRASVVSSDSLDEDCVAKDRVISSGDGVKARMSSSKKYQKLGQKKREFTAFKVEPVGDDNVSLSIECTDPFAMEPLAKKKKIDDREKPLAKKQKIDDTDLDDREKPLAKKQKIDDRDTGDDTPPQTVRENPNKFIDWESLVPRWHGKKSEWQKFCDRFLTKIHRPKNRRFAQIFYLPVDPIESNFLDYWDVVKTPMDLQTIKKKLDYKQYVKPGEFASDMNLMIDNCCKYVPDLFVYHQNALELKALFDEYWKDLPLHLPYPSAIHSSSPQLPEAAPANVIDESSKKESFDAEVSIITQAFDKAVKVTTLRDGPKAWNEWESFASRWHGEKPKWHEFCERLLTEICNIHNKIFAQVFYWPLDPFKFDLLGFWDSESSLVKTPMDLYTIKEKLNHMQYIKPEEFAADMNLLIGNCFRNVPDPFWLYECAFDLKSLFDNRWKFCPKIPVQRPQQTVSEVIGKKELSLTAQKDQNVSNVNHLVPTDSLVRVECPRQYKPRLPSKANSSVQSLLKNTSPFQNQTRNMALNASGSVHCSSNGSSDPHGKFVNKKVTTPVMSCLTAARMNQKLDNKQNMFAVVQQSGSSASSLGTQ